MLRVSSGSRNGLVSSPPPLLCHAWPSSQGFVLGHSAPGKGNSSVATAYKKQMLCFSFFGRVSWFWFGFFFCKRWNGVLCGHSYRCVLLSLPCFQRCHSSVGWQGGSAGAHPHSGAVTQLCWGSAHSGGSTIAMPGAPAHLVNLEKCFHLDSGLLLFQQINRSSVGGHGCLKPVLGSSGSVCQCCTKERCSWWGAASGRRLNLLLIILWWFLKEGLVDAVSYSACSLMGAVNPPVVRGAVSALCLWKASCHSAAGAGTLQAIDRDNLDKTYCFALFCSSQYFGIRGCIL